jgi:WD40 repeat protein
MSSGMVLPILNAPGQIYNRPLAFSPDGKKLAYLIDKTTVGLWDISSGNLQYTFNCPEGNHWIIFSPDGQSLAIGSWRSGITLFSIFGGEKLSEIDGSFYFNKIFFSTDSKMLIAIDERMGFYDVNNGALLQNIDIPSNVLNLNISPNGQTILVYDYDGNFYLLGVKK